MFLRLEFRSWFSTFQPSLWVTGLNRRLQTSFPHGWAILIRSAAVVEPHQDRHQWQEGLSETMMIKMIPNHQNAVLQGFKQMILNVRKFGSGIFVPNLDFALWGPCSTQPRTQALVRRASDTSKRQSSGPTSKRHNSDLINLNHLFFVTGLSVGAVYTGL